MRARCNCKTNKRYKDYGGRGITIALEWNDFQIFADWSYKNGYRPSYIPNMRNSMSLDRINSNGGYFPQNCRWVTKATNSKLKTSSLDDYIVSLEQENILLEIYLGHDYA